MGLVHGDVDLSLANWSDLFLSAADDHVPKSNVKNVNNHPWIDNELRSMLKKKDVQRKKDYQNGLALGEEKVQ